MFVDGEAFIGDTIQAFMNRARKKIVKLLHLNGMKKIIGFRINFSEQKKRSYNKVRIIRPRRDSIVRAKRSRYFTAYS